LSQKTALRRKLGRAE